MNLIEVRKKYLEVTPYDNKAELHIILGSMFSGKTSYLLSIIETAGRVDKVLYINHLSDNLRNKGNLISTHSSSKNIEKVISEMNGEAIMLNKILDYPLENLINTDGTLKFSTACIDEIQFFTDLKEAVELFVDVLCIPYVYVVGLDGDSNRENFGEVHKLIPQADSYIKLKTRCELCAKSKKHEYALFTHKFDKNTDQIVIGGSDKFIPLCRKCWNQLNRK